MNTVIGRKLKEGSPKISILEESMRKKYEIGLNVFGLIISEDFFDIEELGENKYEKEGLFYSFPYYSSEVLLEEKNEVMLLVIYEIERTADGMSSCCPLRINFKLDEDKNVSYIVYDQRGERTTNKVFAGRDAEGWYTEIEGFEKKKLSDLLA